MKLNLSSKIIVKAKLVFDPFDYVESCEENCTPERHAYHQGQWDMATRIQKYLDEQLKLNNDEDKN